MFHNQVYTDESEVYRATQEAKQAAKIALRLQSKAVVEANLRKSRSEAYVQAYYPIYEGHYRSLEKEGHDFAYYKGRQEGMIFIARLALRKIDSRKSKIFVYGNTPADECIRRNLLDLKKKVFNVTETEIELLGLESLKGFEFENEEKKKLVEQINSFEKGYDDYFKRPESQSQLSEIRAKEWIELAKIKQETQQLQQEKKKQQIVNEPRLQGKEPRPRQTEPTYFFLNKNTGFEMAVLGPARLSVKQAESDSNQPLTPRPKI